MNNELKSNVEGLARSNRDLQNLLAAADIATVFLDRDLRILRFTPSATTLFNFSSTDLGRPLSDVTRNLDYPEIVADAARALTHLQPAEREVRAGEHLYVARTLPYRTHDDHIAGVVLTFTDITTTKQAETTAARLAAIVESSSDAIVGKDLRGVITSWNAGAEAIFGYTAAEMIGQPIARLIPAERMTEEVEILRKIGAGERIETFETVRVRKDGTTVPLSVTISPIKDAAGKIIGGSKIARDISDAKRIGDALRGSEERLRLATDAAGLGIWTWQPETDQVVWENHWPHEILGVPLGEKAINAARFAAEIVHPEDRAAFERAVAETLQNEASFYYKGRLRRPDGEVRWVEFTGKRMQTPAGIPAALVGIAQDVTRREQSEVIVRQNATLFSTLIEQTPTGTYVLDAQLRFRQVNAAAKPAFGSVQPLLGRDLQEVTEILWGPEIGRRIADIFRHTLETGERYISPPFTEKRHDVGLEQTYEWQTQRVTLPDGQYGVVCYFNDVTERARATSALRASQERMRLAAEATGVGIWEWNLRTNSIHWDAVMFALYGIEPTPDGIVDYSAWREAVYPEDLAENEETLQDTVRRAGDSSRAFRIRRKSDGECRHIKSVETARTNDQGKTEWIIGTNLDVTESRKAEDARRQNEALFSTLIEQAPLGVYVVDAQFRLQQVNSLAQPVFGDYRSLIGREFTEVMTIVWGPVVGPDVARIFRHTLETGERYISPPFVHARADLGVEQAFDWETQRVTLPNGQHGVVCYFIDVTERRRADEALREAKEAAETANQSKDRFLAVLSHELRTPLTPILMVASAREHDPDLRPDIREDIVMIKRNVELETKLIDDLLDLSRITSGKLELKSERVDLNAAVRQVCSMCQSQVADQQIQLKVELKDDVAVISADPARLQQILWNVLKNAIKFTPAQGTVLVTTSRTGPDRCEVRVQDSGIGIPPDILPRIFNAFEQGDARITRQFGGLGLGLAISRALVELHGGTIRAESQGQGRGATFTVELPGLPPAAAVAAPPLTTAPQGVTPLRLLLVENHPDTAHILTRMLQAKGFTVLSVGDVASAIAAAEREHFDVLVSDLGLPDGDGYQVMRAIRARGLVPGIAMSGYGRPEDTRRSTAAGFAEHLVKPISASQLIDAIRRVTDQRGASPEAYVATD